MKHFVLMLLVATLTACGGGNTPELPKAVTLSDKDIAELPAPFVIGPAGTVPVSTVPVVGPAPAPELPFVIGPVTGQQVTLTPTVIIGPSPVIQPTINYCTDGFVVGPCVRLPTTCQPDASGFVIGPCAQ